MNTTNKIYRAFPGGAVVKTLPSSAAGTCSIPGGAAKTHMPWGQKIKTSRSNIVTKFHKDFKNYSA